MAQQALETKFGVEILDSAGNLVADLTGRVKSRSMRFVRDGVYEASFTMDLDTLEQYCRTINILPISLLSVGQSQVKISRIGIPIFGGQIMFVESSLGETRSITVKAVGWLELLTARFTAASVIYTAQDAGSIAKQLIDTNQLLSGGDLGILTSASYIKASVNRNRTYENKNIKDAIIELSAVKNGFDFEFTWDKKFYVYYPQMGTTRTEFAFEYPGNIKKLRISDDGKAIVNSVLVRGQGFGDAQTTTTRTDSGSFTAYKLRQKILDVSDVIELATLQDHGDEVLRVQASPVRILQITLDGNRLPAYGSYQLGDRVPVRVYGFAAYPIDASYRIDEINIKIDDNDGEEIELKVTL